MTNPSPPDPNQPPPPVVYVQQPSPYVIGKGVSKGVGNVVWWFVFAGALVALGVAGCCVFGLVVGATH